LVGQTSAQFVFADHTFSPVKIVRHSAEPVDVTKHGIGDKV